MEEHTRNVARALRDRGHPVEVWTVDRGEHLGTTVVDGIVVRYLPTPLPSRTLRGVASFALAVLPAWAGWRRARREFRPEVLHVQCFGPNGAYAWALHRMTGIPLVVSAHGETFMDEEDVFTRSRLMAWSLRRALGDAATVTGCSQLVLDDLSTRFGLHRPALVVPNGIDLLEAERLGIGPSERDPDRPPTVVAVARAVRVKGLDLLLRAFAAADRPPRTRLVIGGDGPELATLRVLADDLGVAAQVDFLGRLDRAQVIQAMADADLIVVPSRVEAFGIVVLEAWRSGTALIATSHGGPADLITDGVDGVLVAPEDGEVFAATLSALLSDRVTLGRLGAAGRRGVAAFTWDRTADDYEAVYATVRTEERDAREA
ncbi:glycosyltransferase family 4 protein [Raineyella sp. LH-20]|uniref:glycosyltransferase family 4 protein n=1 Tax=Raineyella sp. LH-20 TaxID=3081204 RepID=UPI0029535268|nr:glycosyltransferase family 4 protein [Raineyella sp. LH-20]WOP17215.1 glycosyltransferase family 4 protein [Raineyella sp. LH-20]